MEHLIPRVMLTGPWERWARINQLRETSKATDVIDYKQRVESNKFKKAWHEEKLRNWKGRNMYSQYLRDMPDVTDVVGMWEWLRKADLKVQADALLCAAQEQAIRTNR